jgi:hypothetical protein
MKSSSISEPKSSASRFDAQATCLPPSAFLPFTSLHHSGGNVSIALAVREATMLLAREVLKTIVPPTIVQNEGRSLVASMTQIGFRIGSITLMTAASRARTWRIATE